MCKKNPEDFFFKNGLLNFPYPYKIYKREREDACSARERGGNIILREAGEFLKTIKSDRLILQFTQYSPSKGKAHVVAAAIRKTVNETIGEFEKSKSIVK